MSVRLPSKEIYNIALLLVLVLHVTKAENTAAGSGIIRTSGTRFVDDQCRDFVFTGINLWKLLEAAAGVDGTDVGSQLDTVKNDGLNVVRAFAFGSDPSFVLQTSPGVYNSRALDGLDKMIYEADKRSLKLILAFSSYWKAADGPITYLGWAGLSKPDDFYTNSTTKQMYKDHLSYIVNRRNALTGRLYKDEPAIFAWNLMNEPRAACDVWHRNSSCDPAPGQAIDAWIGEMSSFLKGVDPNHLVTVGEEGFYGYSSPDRAAKYNAEDYALTKWGISTGQDYVPNHAHPSIDFASVHIWPDNWQANETFCGKGNPSCGPAFVANFIDSHAEDAQAMGKPFVIEEYGKQTGNALPYFQMVYQKYLDSIQNSTSGVLRGIAYWGTGVSSEVVGQSIAPGATATNQYLAQAARVPGCTEVNPQPASPVPSQASSGGGTSPPPSSAPPTADILSAFNGYNTGGRRLLKNNL